MNDSLTKKLREVENDHAEGVVATDLAQYSQTRRDTANRYIGGAMAIDKLKEHLTSQVILALMTVEEEKLYLEFDCQTFAEFLDRKEFSEMSKSTFYRLRDLYLKEGITKFDLLTEWGIPAKLRKQLDSGDIEIDGDEIVIGGDERVSIGESPKVIKAIIEKLVSEKSAISDELAKSEAKSLKQKEQIKQGISEVESLQRNLDALRTGDPHDEALSQAVYSMLQLTEQVGQLPDERKAAKGRDAIDTLWGVMQKVRSSYGVNYNFAEATPAPAANDLEAKLNAALAEPDDLDDEAPE
jgi:hypothetical protein